MQFKHTMYFEEQSNFGLKVTNIFDMKAHSFDHHHTSIIIIQCLLKSFPILPPFYPLHPHRISSFNKPALHTITSVPNINFHSTTFSHPGTLTAC